MNIEAEKMNTIMIIDLEPISHKNFRLEFVFNAEIKQYNLMLQIT